MTRMPRGKGCGMHVAQRSRSQHDASRAHIMQSQPRQPRDDISRLQGAVMDACGLYPTALGLVQNAADEAVFPTGDPVRKQQAQDTMARLASGTIAEDIVSAHLEIERQVDELERAYRSDAEEPLPGGRTQEWQLQKLQKLQQQHTEVTQVLRAETERAESAHAGLKRDLDTLLDGILEVNSQHRRSAEAATSATT